MAWSWRERGRRRAVLPWMTAVLLLVTGCGSGRTTALVQPRDQGTVTDPPTPTAAGVDWSSVAAKAMAAWNDFPVGAQPRPVVLLVDEQWFDVGGFTGQDAKGAFLSGDWTGPSQLPSGPTQYQGRPIISARQALDRLRAAENDTEIRNQVRNPLTITDVKLGADTVQTDRGRQTVPAWQFTFTGADGPAQVPALAPPQGYPVPGGGGSGYPSAKQALGGRELAFIVTTPHDIDPGMEVGRDPCKPTIFPEEAHVEVAETAHAVAFNIVWAPLPPARAVTAPPNPKTGCPAVTTAPEEQTVTLRLDAPLGNRVLLEVDDHGNAGPTEVDPVK